MAFEKIDEKLKLKHQVNTTINSSTNEMWQLICARKQMSSHALLRDVIMTYCHTEILKADPSKAYTVLEAFSKR
jgi:hypothetical protein